MRADVSSKRRWSPTRQTWGHLTVWVVLLAMSMLQRPGQTTFDTKFDLTASPLRFLGRSLHLWNPDASLGELQNQAYGYLFPEGSFFALGNLAHLPDWVVQRLWCAVLLLAAYEGTRRLFLALTSSASWVPAVLAGLAYAVAPRMLGLVGVLSGEIIPTAVLPWVILPLVLAQRGRLSLRSGALLSGLAVLCMGGINAVENVAALPLAALVIVLASPKGMVVRLSGWWLLAVSAASAWWIVPLLLLGRYSPPFLDYVETSAATTRPLTWFNVVRGSDHWLAFVKIDGRPWWPAAFDLATVPSLVLATGVVAAIGLVGLFLPSMPWRRPLVASALLGLACLYVGHSGPVGSPLSGPVQGLLDGPLAVFRNIHKVDPLVRLPLSLGFAHASWVVGRRLVMRKRLARRPALVGSVTAVVFALVLLSAAQPMFHNRLRTPGWRAVPSAWSETAGYLQEHSHGRRAWIVPGSGFAQQSWGPTMDEPFQGLAQSPWITRSQVPLAPGQTIRFLDSIEGRVFDATGSFFLADVLARSGIGYVVARHDLDLSVSDAPSSSDVDAALSRSPGLHRVASFGHTGFGGQTMIDVYKVERPVPLVDATDVAGVKRLAGGPDDVITALESGLLGRDDPVVISTEPGWAPGPVDFVGDGYRLRERQFGRVHDAVSADMSPDDSYRVARRTHDYPGVPGTPRVVLDDATLRSASASSSAGYADAFGPIHPDEGPYAAVDGNGETSWQSAPFDNPTGQWVELHLREPQPLTQLRVEFDVDLANDRSVTQALVQAGQQTHRESVDPETGLLSLPLSGSPVRSIRITITRVDGASDEGVVGIREISFPGDNPRQRLVVPPAPTDRHTVFVLRADPGRRACVPTLAGPDCDPAAARPPEAQNVMTREISVDHSGSWFLSGQVVARSTTSTARLTRPIDGSVRVRASSVLAEDPAVSGQSAYDDDIGTAWLSAAGDQSPTLGLRWSKVRTLSRLLVVNASARASAPSQAVIRSGQERRTVALTPGSFGYFEPLRTNHVSITFPRPSGASGPVGVGELRIAGLDALRYHPEPDQPTGAICGIGPELQIDRRTYPTKVDGSMQSVTSGMPLRVSLCGRPIRLGAGTHEVRMQSTEQFAPVNLVLSPRHVDVSAPMKRDVSIEQWRPTERVVKVGPGDEALLRIPENVNPGWVATLDGRKLRSTRVDGWQQAYVVPSGAGGTVTLEFAPDAPYRVGLLVGTGLVALLLLGALLSLVRDRGRLPSEDVPKAATRSWSLWSGTAALLLATVIGGLAVGAGGLLAVIMRRRRPRAEIVAAILLAAAAATAAASAWWGRGESPLPANVAAGVAVGVLVMTWRTWTARSREEPHE